jgi:hypothetical protein
MKTNRPWGWKGLAGLGLVLVGLCGCQTYWSGATLPSPHYLEHPPVYIPPSPPYPFPRELAAMQEQALAVDAAAPGGLPPRVPAGPVGP